MGKMKKGTKIFLILAVVIVVIAAALIGLVRAGQSALQAMTTGAASYTALERMDLTNTLSVSGNIQSADVKKVYQEANGAGKALQVNVEVGDTVAEGDVLFIEKLNAEAESTVKFDQVLAVLDGDNTKIGAPVVEGAAVEAKVVKNGKGKKLDIIRYKAKKGEKRHIGHRQPYTKVEITKIAL